MHTKNAIESINRCEKKWKIHTNATKFKIIPIIPIGRTTSAPVVADGDIYEYATEGTVLGVKITRTGFISTKINKLNCILTRLCKFYGLTPKNKRKLYLVLMRSVIEYPPIPQVAMKISNLNSLQIIQNKALRFIYDIKYPDIVRNEELHNRANLPAIKELLLGRGIDKWRKITTLEINNSLYELTTSYEGTNENFWFPISYAHIHSND